MAAVAGIRPPASREAPGGGGGWAGVVGGPCEGEHFTAERAALRTPPSAAMAASSPGRPQHAPPVRLYVGGLASPAALAGLGDRFTPFGRVLAVDAPAPKGLGDGADVGLRGFAYVDLAPADDGAVRRCLSAVRGGDGTGGGRRRQAAAAPAAHSPPSSPPSPPTPPH